MPNYATSAELIARFASEAECASYTDTESTGIANAAVLTDCLENAEADIDTRIGQRFKTPVIVTGNVTLTAILKRKTLDLAVWYLVGGRTDHASDDVKDAAERALSWADGVSKGMYTLPGAVTPPSTASRAPLASWSDSAREIPETSGRLATRDAMAGL